MFFSFKHLIISFLLVSSIIHSNGMEKMVFSEWNKPEINIFYKLPNNIERQLEFDSGVRQCHGKTAKGNRCKNLVSKSKRRSGNYCFLHKDQESK